MEAATEKPRRYIPVSEYVRIYGLSQKTVRHGLGTGQIKGIKTETGKWRVDTFDGNNFQSEFVMQRMDKHEKLLLALCKQFGIVVPE